MTPGLGGDAHDALRRSARQEGRVRRTSPPRAGVRPVRRLFEEQAAIQEYEVNTHWRPDLAHSGYWGNEEVQREIARLVVANL